MCRQRLFPVLLCGAALFAFACGGAGREAEQVDAETETQAEAEKPETWQIVDEPAEDQKPAEETNELRPEPREVRVDAQDLEQPPGNDRETELAEREQRLAERQAEIAARERELREREERAAAQPAPEPEPVETEEEVTGSEEPELSPEPVEPEPAQPSRTVSATLPAGTLLEAELLQQLSSNGSTAGETFRARLVEDVLDEGEVVIPAGSEVVGVVDEAVPLRRVGGRAKLVVRFTDVVLPSGSTVPIRASLIQQGRSETGKDAATIGGAAAGGAILGRILNKGDRSKGAVIGAIIGAAAGTAIASRTPGEEVVFPEGTVINLGLDEDVEVRARR